MYHYLKVLVGMPTKKWLPAVKLEVMLFFPVFVTSKHDMGTTISEKHYMVNITWFDQFKELKKYLRNVYDGNLATSFFFFFC